MVHGQDFCFCGHHTVELAHAIRSLGAAGASPATVKDGDAAPSAHLAAELLLTGSPQVAGTDGRDDLAADGVAVAIRTQLLLDQVHRRRKLVVLQHVADPS